MDDPNVVVGITVVLIIILSLSIHEFCHAIVAYWCGDTTAKDLGRMTMNPIVHIDPIFTIAVPLVLYFMGGPIFGGAKPVPVNPANLRHPMRDMALVAIAGPLSNFILAFLFFGLLGLARYNNLVPDGSVGYLVLWYSGLYNVLLGVFNMIPVPPLDGSRVMSYLLPRHLAEPYMRLEMFGIFIVFGLFFMGAFKPILEYAVWPVQGIMVRFWNSVFF